MLATTFLEKTTVHVPNPDDSVSIVFNGPTTKMFKHYRRVPGDFDTKKLEEGQKLRKFPTVTEAPAYALKKPTGKGSDTFDPPVPLVELGDTIAFQARLRRCLKHMMMQLAPKRGTDRVVMPCEQFRRIVEQIAVVRATVPVDDILKGLLQNGTLAPATNRRGEASYTLTHQVYERSGQV
jgi:hypothetical protein